VVLVGAIVTAAILLPVGARAVAGRYHDDSLWANAVGSLGGANRPGDFGYVFLPTAESILAGRSPYMDPEDFRGPPQAPYAYPPVLALLLTPLAVLPEEPRGVFVPGVVFSLALIAAMIGALLLLDVRDWRCYPVVLAYPVTLEAIEYGAVGPLLVLLVALIWRLRDKLIVAGLGTGGVVVLKLFLWPLALWLALTGRVRAAALAVATAVGLAAASWAVIGFDGLDRYPRLLEKLVEVEAENSYSAFAISRALGLSELAARSLAALVGFGLLALAARAARASAVPRLDRDRRSLILVLAAALVLTPILWLHYLVLLVVPIALSRPRLSALWFAPLVLTVFELLDWYRGWPSGDGPALASVATVVVVVFMASLWSRGRSAETPRSIPTRA
jgi:hypothetical protein